MPAGPLVESKCDYWMGVTVASGREGLGRRRRGDVLPNRARLVAGERAVARRSRARRTRRREVGHVGRRAVAVVRPSRATRTDTQRVGESALLWRNRGSQVVREERLAFLRAAEPRESRTRPRIDPLPHAAE